jgi:hypothetical protein
MNIISSIQGISHKKTNTFIQPILSSQLYLWLDANNISSVIMDYSNHINTWVDQSTKQNTVIQTNTSNQPSYISNGFNGKPSILFNPGNYLSIITNDFNNLSNLNVFFVLNQTYYSEHPSPSVFSLYPGISFYLTTNIHSNPSTFNNETFSEFSNQSITPNVNIILSLIIQNGTQTLNINGTEGNSTAVTFTGNTGLQLNIGKSGDNDNDLFSGYISEILIYNSTLTTDNIQSIEGYLAWKWGLEQQLPSSHSYFSHFP